MKRITYKETKESDGGFGFVTRGLFFKDGVEFARLSEDLIKDLKFYFRDDDIIRNEVKAALFYELNDPLLEEECLQVLEEEFLKTRI